METTPQSALLTAPAPPEFKASFNLESTAFTCILPNGFAVYNCDPPSERFNRVGIPARGEFIIAEILGTTNILALVPLSDPKKIIIWDDHTTKETALIQLHFPVTKIILRRDILAFRSATKLYIYKMASLNVLTKEVDCSGAPGHESLLTASTDPLYCKIAVPGTALGTVYVDDITLGKSVVIQAHNSHICALALNHNGSLLSTASERGTLVRIWNTATGDLVKELRRGTTPAHITSIAFNIESTRIAVMTAHGTLHIFCLSKDSTNRKSVLSPIGGYFGSEWSEISIPVWAAPKGQSGLPQIAFGKTRNIVNVLTPDGIFMKWSFDAVDESARCEQTVGLISA